MKRPVNLIVGFLAVAFVATVPMFSQVAKGGGQAVIQPALASPEQKLSCPANFITCLTLSPDGKTIAVGTEDHGLLIGRLSKTGKVHSWQTFNRNAGVNFRSNNVYSVCFDSQSRLWAGTLRSGVEVGFCKNGQWHWRDYDVVPNVPAARNPNNPALAGQNYAFSGPLGSHVFAIAENPKDQRMWMATEAGIAIYTPRFAKSHRLPPQRHLNPANLTAFGQWRYITNANGLPNSPPDSIAFLPNGRVIVGTQCDGICMAGPQDHYRHWRIIRGPGRMPTTAYGRGIPSGLINAVATAGRRHVYVATDSGLAVSANGGNTFRYERGADFAAKVQGLQFPPQNWQSPSKSDLQKLLPEDYITTLIMRGHLLWLGFRRQGFMAINTITQAQFRSADSPALTKAARYVTAILPLPHGRVLLGHYGKGLSELTVSEAQGSPGPTGDLNAHPHGMAAMQPKKHPLSPPRFPASATIPTAMQLKAMTRRLKRFAAGSAPVAAYLGEDWRTQGDWVGHYGRQYAVLWAADSPLDTVEINPRGEYMIDACLGPQHSRGDGLRHWIQWINADNQPRVLYNPTFGERREAEIDDHGEVKSPDASGPGIWIKVTVPRGPTLVSLYFVNKDGHSGPNRCRDYTITVRRSSTSAAQVLRNPVLATGRVVNFWSGVYQRFLLEGPGRYILMLNRNHSLNTICSGTFLDRLSPRDRPRAYPYMWSMATVIYRIPPMPGPRAQFKPSKNRRQSVMPLGRINLAKGLFGRYAAAIDPLAALAAYRHVLAAKTSPVLLYRDRWELNIWSRLDRTRFADVMAAGWKANVKLNPQLIHGKTKLER
ncbi:MAG: two-component regulator propeller domain-containing protein [Phycisphaerae bacterium]